MGKEFWFLEVPAGGTAEVSVPAGRLLVVTRACLSLPEGRLPFVLTGSKGEDAPADWIGLALSTGPMLLAEGPGRWVQLAALAAPHSGAPGNTAETFHLVGLGGYRRCWIANNLDSVRAQQLETAGTWYMRMYWSMRHCASSLNPLHITPSAPQVLHSDAIFAAEACLRRHGSKQNSGRGGVSVHLTGWLEDRE